ncbi:MAG: hypothetical protein RR846_02720 [Oscillospiraceae bacterium]
MPEPWQKKRIDEIVQALNWDSRKIMFKNDRLGNTNTSLLCEYLGEKYIFRIGTALIEKISINRKNEQSTIKNMMGENFNFDVIFFSEKTGDMVSKYIDGESIAPKIYDTEKFIDDACDVLKKFHKHSAEYYFYPMEDIEKRIELVKTNCILRQDKFVNIYNEYIIVADRQKKTDEEFVRFCHNDTYLSNFKYDNNRQLHLLDYEFSGMGNMFFDMACIAHSPLGKLGEERVEQLIKNMLGSYSDQLRKNLEDYIVIQLMWNCTWAAVKATENEIGREKFCSLTNRYIQLLGEILNIP